MYIYVNKEPRKRYRVIHEFYLNGSEYYLLQPAPSLEDPFCLKLPFVVKNGDCSPAPEEEPLVVAPEWINVTDECFEVGPSPVAHLIHRMKNGNVDRVCAPYGPYGYRFVKEDRGGGFQVQRKGG